MSIEQDLHDDQRTFGGVLAGQHVRVVSISTADGGTGANVALPSSIDTYRVLSRMSTPSCLFDIILCVDFLLGAFCVFSVCPAACEYLFSLSISCCNRQTWSNLLCLQTKSIVRLLALAVYWLYYELRLASEIVIQPIVSDESSGSILQSWWWWRAL